MADRLLGLNGYAAEPDALTYLDTSGASLPPAFAVQLVLRLRDQDPTVTPARRWLDERLTSQGTTADEIVHEEHQRQGTSNVTVRNIITSMRLLSDVDWQEFSRASSLVDETVELGERLCGNGFRKPRSIPPRDRSHLRAAQSRPSSPLRAQPCRLEVRLPRTTAPTSRTAGVIRLPPDRRRPARL